MKARKKYEELTFTDDFMFCKVMETNPELCKGLLELILGVKIKEIVSTQNQLAIKHTYDGKGVRFDVFIEDDVNTVYDIEMQTTTKPEIPKRSRYYQGMLDLNLLQEGDSYKALKQSFVIFICLDDPFGKNLPRYSFKYYCTENKSIEFDDGTTKVIINAGGDRSGLSDEMVAFLDYLKYNKAESNLTRELQKAVNRGIKSKRWRVEFMTLEMKIQEEREEARAEGLAEGLATKQNSIIINMLRKGMAFEDIADFCECDVEHVAKIASTTA